MNTVRLVYLAQFESLSVILELPFNFHQLHLSCYTKKTVDSCC